MNIYVNCISADTALRLKKDEEVLKHITLVNPQCYEGNILFDMQITLPDSFTLSRKYDGYKELMIITLGNIGAIELDTKDFRDIIIN